MKIKKKKVNKITRGLTVRVLVLPTTPQKTLNNSSSSLGPCRLKIPKHSLAKKKQKNKTRLYERGAARPHAANKHPALITGFLWPGEHVTHAQPKPSWTEALSRRELQASRTRRPGDSLREHFSFPGLDWTGDPPVGLAAPGLIREIGASAKSLQSKRTGDNVWMWTDGPLGRDRLLVACLLAALKIWLIGELRGPTEQVVLL